MNLVYPRKRKTKGKDITGSREKKVLLGSGEESLEVDGLLILLMQN